MKRTLLALLSALLLLPASPALATHPCGQTPDGQLVDADPYHSHPGCTTSSGPAVGDGDVVLREADAGRTVTLARGQRLHVGLGGPSGPLWTEVAGGQALHRVFLDAHSYGTRAVFTALAPTAGEQVTATAVGCGPTTDQCAPRTWAVTVVVQDGPAPPAEAVACRSRAPLPARDDVVQLGEGDDGRTVRVARGDVLAVQFPGCRGDGVDLAAAVAGAPLFRYRASQENPGGATALFRAQQPGTTVVEAPREAACLHTPEAQCAAGEPWRVTVTVTEACRLSGHAEVEAGQPAQLTGRFGPGATVLVWFRPYGGSAFAVRRTLTADPYGYLSTSFTPLVDHRWYATSGDDCTTGPGLTRVLPTLSGPAFADRGSAVPVVVRGPAGQPVALYARRPFGEYRLVRTGRLDSAGTWRTTYAAVADHRYYAITGPDRRHTRDVLTQVR